jgi:hypothetical protein
MAARPGSNVEPGPHRRTPAIARPFSSGRRVCRIVRCRYLRSHVDGSSQLNVTVPVRFGDIDILTLLQRLGPVVDCSNGIYVPPGSTTLPIHRNARVGELFASRQPGLSASLRRRSPSPIGWNLLLLFLRLRVVNPGGPTAAFSMTFRPGRTTRRARHRMH